MPTLATERLNFFYRRHGAVDGLPLLLLHGSYGSSRWWEPLFAVLPDEIEAVAPDLRGCGASEKSAAGYAIEEQAQDVAALVDALGWNHFHLAAHSSSGAIAIEYALLRPETLATLLLINSVPVEGVFTPLETLTLLEQMKNDHALLSEALALLMPAFDTANDPFFQQLVNDAAQMAPAAFSEIALALGRWNRFADARTLTTPTLLIWGEQDEIVSREAMTRSLLAIPGAANLEVLPKCGHSPMIESPLLLAERMVEFITQDFAGYAAMLRR
jgi:branched-chain amino acid transport system permease protein